MNFSMNFIWVSNLNRALYIGSIIISSGTLIILQRITLKPSDCSSSQISWSFTEILFISLESPSFITEFQSLFHPTYQPIRLHGILVTEEALEEGEIKERKHKKVQKTYLTFLAWCFGKFTLNIHHFSSLDLSMCRKLREEPKP